MTAERIPRMDNCTCPHCGAVWAVVLTPVSCGPPKVLQYRGTCICGYAIKNLDAFGHVASLFSLIKRPSSET